MATVRVLVLRAAGTNCDEETAFAFKLAGAKADRVHVNRLREHPALLERYQVVAIPGGFTYGDDLGAGTVLANELHCSLRDQLGAFLDRDRLILGICNGFQVLVKMDLLPRVADLDGQRQATLAPEAQERLAVTLDARQGVVRFRVEPADALLTVGGRKIGRPPSSLRLLAVDQRIEISKPGYETYRTRITPRPGFDQEIRISLKRKGAARPTPPMYFLAIFS